jgi:hypothetical protein
MFTGVGLLTIRVMPLPKKQMRGFGGMISFTLKDDSVETAMKLLSSTKVFALAESLGGVESLINHPATMTHASIPREERKKNGLSDSLIRLSVGIEDAEDLIDDLQAAIGYNDPEHSGRAVTKSVERACSERSRRVETRFNQKPFTMKQPSLKDFLNRKTKEYNQPLFIKDDPVSIPHLFTRSTRY